MGRREHSVSLPLRTGPVSWKHHPDPKIGPESEVGWDFTFTPSRKRCDRSPLPSLLPATQRLLHLEPIPGQSSSPTTAATTVTEGSSRTGMVPGPGRVGGGAGGPLSTRSFASITTGSTPLGLTHPRPVPCRVFCYNPGTGTSRPTTAAIPTVRTSASRRGYGPCGRRPHWEWDRSRPQGPRRPSDPVTNKVPWRERSVEDRRPGGSGKVPLSSSRPS